MLHRRLGTILSYVTQDYSVRLIFLIIKIISNYRLQITNDNDIIIYSDELNVNVRKSSSAWLSALEKFDRDIDINSMTKKEVEQIENASIIVSCSLF